MLAKMLTFDQHGTQSRICWDNASDEWARTQTGCERPKKLGGPPDIDSQPHACPVSVVSGVSEA